MKREKVIMLRAFIIAAASFVLSTILSFTGILDYFENKTYDQRMIFSSRYKSPASDIYFIGVDQNSIDWASNEYGWSWPWPREAYGRMIDFFSQGNAASITFDILYTEPSVYGEEDDLKLALAEKNSGRVIQTLFVSSDKDGNKSAQFPVPPVRDNAALIGNITSVMDDDDIIRRAYLEYEYEGKTYPSLGTASLYLTGQADFSRVPRLKDGTVLLRYQKSIDDYHPYWAMDIFKSIDQYKIYKEAESNGASAEELEALEPMYWPEDFEDEFVFVAYYAPGLFDICSTPVSQVFPGVGVHITVLDNYLTDNFMHKVPSILMILWIFAAALYGAFGVSFASSRKNQNIQLPLMVATFLSGLILCIGLPYFLFIFNYWIYIIGPFIAFLTSFIVSVIISFAAEGKQKRFIKTAFSQCLSKDVVNQIINDPASFTLGGKKFQMTAIFTDIQKFSSFSELLTAGQLGQLLNYYLTRMSEIIIEEYGTVDKYEGDAIVAMVGAPVEMEDHAVRACTAAVKMKRAEIKMNEEIVKCASLQKNASMDIELYEAFRIMVENKKTIFTRIGINSGEMIAGYFGSENKKNYTMMGNNVNLASRLEGVNKQYHTNGILISEASRNLLGEIFILRSLDKVRVVNVNTPIRLYELIEETSSASEEMKDYVLNWESFMEKFEEGDYSQALEKLNDLMKKKLYADGKKDDVACYYKHLLENYFIKGKYPVENDNEGVVFNPQDKVFTLLQK